MQVGSAQKWYDDMDNTFFVSSSDEEIISEEDNKTSDGDIYINCSVNTSPGTSEVCLLQ